MRRRGPWARRFGCLFGIAFLIGVVGLVGLISSVVMASGPFGDVARALGIGIIVLGIVAIAGSGRTFRRVAVSLDELVEAADRVEHGDYSTRVAVPRTGAPPDARPRPRLQRDGHPARGRRGTAADACSPT